MKPLAVYKLSRIETAMRRLDAAVAGLEEACAAREASGASLPLSEDVARLRRDYEALATAARAASTGMERTISRLNHLLES